MNDVKETPVAFGPERALIGVVSVPGGGDTLPVGCLMLNMGAIHRAGPRRINVKLARELAARGVPSLRLDLTGLGDSGSARGAEHFSTQSVRDLQAAMDLMQSMLGVRRFIIIGLCSGASNGLSVAVHDARVCGLLMFDGYSFPGRRSNWERTARRALAAPANPAFYGKTWRWLQRHFSREAALAAAPSIFEPDPPEVVQAHFRRSMTQLHERGVAVLLYYTGTIHVVDRDHDQLGPFAHEPFLAQAEYRFDPAVDHSVTSLAAQRTFLQLVTDWVLRVVNAPAPRTPQARGEAGRLSAPAAISAVPQDAPSPGPRPHTLAA